MASLTMYIIGRKGGDVELKWNDVVRNAVGQRAA
jgi:hypothetical protein